VTDAQRASPKQNGQAPAKHNTSEYQTIVVPNVRDLLVGHEVFGSGTCVALGVCPRISSKAPIFPDGLEIQF